MRLDWAMVEERGMSLNSGEAHPPPMTSSEEAMAGLQSDIALLSTYPSCWPEMSWAGREYRMVVRS